MRSISAINEAAHWCEEDIPLSHHSGYRKIVAMIDRLPLGSVLEVGCGRGRLLEYLQARGHEVHGLELQPQSAAFIQQADLSQPWPLTRQYDVVIASEVIEHIVDTDGFLEQCHAALRPGGTLFLTTPNLLFGVNRLRMLVGMQPMFAYADWHVRMFVWADLKEKLERRFVIRRLRGTHVLAGVRHTRLFEVFAWLGDLVPRLAAHFVVEARPK